MATWEDVRALALALPETEESTSYGKLAFKVRRKTFAWESPHEHGKLVVNVDPDERPLLVESNPAAYFVTSHYQGYPMLLIHLEQVRRAELRERIEDAWLLAAPPKLASTLG
ncbi:MAG: MmcQ/YjbR family DNA-binding protein [Gaiellaceae bacterium MAG52_C11]|nr:MmcQ/YjbR family DNA-binding protein [Candidatus Gaiellasilicea maunaloa]